MDDRPPVAADHPSGGNEPNASASTNGRPTTTAVVRSVHGSGNATNATGRGRAYSSTGPTRSGGGSRIEPPVHSAEAKSLTRREDVDGTPDRGKTRVEGGVLLALPGTRRHDGRVVDER